LGQKIPRRGIVSMTYCRIDLSKTNYQELEYYTVLNDTYYHQITDIYYQYCSYKKFTSVVPIFYEDITSPYTEILGYYHDNNLVAFSLIYLYNSSNCAAAEQFAWDYKTPNLRLGYRSLENECARYKRLGYDYLYIGEYDKYKESFDGFEIVGTLDDRNT